MHFATFLIALSVADGVLTASSLHKRAAKYERKNRELPLRAKQTISKRQSTSSYLTDSTACV